MALDRTSFAAALKMHRRRLGLTQAEAATILDVSPRGLWKWENEAGDTLAVTMEGVIDRLKFAGSVRKPKSATLSIRILATHKARFESLTPKPLRRRIVEAWIEDGCPVSEKALDVRIPWVQRAPVRSQARTDNQP